MNSALLLRASCASTLIAVSICSTGCFWKKDDTIRPQASKEIYGSPVKSDPGRTGDYRRDPLRATNGSMAGNTNLTVQRTSDATGSTIFVGAVVAEVNGAPIYAHELLEQVAPALRSRANDLDARAFEKLATEELRRQRENLIQNELVFAAAVRATTLDEQDKAKFITNMIYEKYVSAAGGSRELPPLPSASDSAVGGHRVATHTEPPMSFVQW